MSFCFSIGSNPKIGTFALIVSKDTERDKDEAITELNSIMPPEFVEFMPQTYTFSGSTTDAREALLALGFIEVQRPGMLMN